MDDSSFFFNEPEDPDAQDQDANGQAANDQAAHDPAVHDPAARDQANHGQATRDLASDKWEVVCTAIHTLLKDVSLISVKMLSLEANSNWPVKFSMLSIWNRAGLLPALAESFSQKKMYLGQTKNFNNSFFCDY